jgi:hypothetical protein
MRVRISPIAQGEIIILYEEKLQNILREKFVSRELVSMDIFPGSGNPTTEQVAKEIYDVLVGCRKVIDETNMEM